MVEKPYDFGGGAILGEHSKQKHKVLREYFYRYIKTRCQLPQQSKFRLAVVDGFAGGGKYEDGSSGSPLIFIEELIRSIAEINISRATQNFRPLDIQCLLLLNDVKPDVIEILRQNVAPLLARVAESEPHLDIEVQFSCGAFEEIFPTLKNKLQKLSFKNVLMNLDQCGHSRVDWRTLENIMASFRSAEVFYTFSIDSFLAFLQRDRPEVLTQQFEPFGISSRDIERLSDDLVNKKNWLGAAERLVFDELSVCAPFVSPFSINNPNGWRYWLVHLANSYRAREVYNDILHEHSSSQAHFGRSGLQMLHFDPDHAQSSTLYLFDADGRSSARNQLYDDIPRLIGGFGNTLQIGDLYSNIYNTTPAHSDDVRSSIIENPDLEIITQAGGERRMAHTIELGDTIRLKRQTRFIFPNDT
jgi:three-Cys-motif partner protein